MKAMEDLQYKGLKIIQDKDKFCFGMDSILLSDFAKEIKKGENVLDLGTGTGVISVLLCGKTELGKITGIEIQKDFFDLAMENIKLNKLEKRMNVICGDIKKIDCLLPSYSFDSIVTNPPYKKCGTGMKNENYSKQISRHEIECSLEDLIVGAEKMLKNNGKFYMVHRPERLIDILETLRKNKLEPKKIRFVYPKIGAKSNLILVKAVKNGKQFLEVQEPLIVYDEKNQYTDEILKIYNKE